MVLGLFHYFLLTYVYFSPTANNKQVIQ